MKHMTLIAIFATTLFANCSPAETHNVPGPASPQANDNGKFQYSLKTAHPNAQALMTEEFYFSPIEETAPFGNDDGWDAAYSFMKWRFLHKVETPVSFLNQWIDEAQYPKFDYFQLDTT